MTDRRGSFAQKDNSSFTQQAVPVYIHTLSLKLSSACLLLLSLLSTLCSKPSRVLPHTPAFACWLLTLAMANPQQEATDLKNKGNEAFKNQDWPTALEFYTKAIESYDKEPSFYTNRAQVHLPLQLTRPQLLTSQ